MAMHKNRGAQPHDDKGKKPSFNGELMELWEAETRNQNPKSVGHHFGWLAD